MKFIEQNIKIKVLESVADYPDYLIDLMNLAEDQLEVAYAPYSEFYVGAAVLMENGDAYVGCNQENSSYPLCICGERVALYNAGANSNLIIKALAIVARNPNNPLLKPVSPCRACRQVILEFEEKQNSDIEIYLKGENQIVYKVENAKQLLPFHFGKEFL